MESATKELAKRGNCCHVFVLYCRSFPVLDQVDQRIRFWNKLCWILATMPYISERDDEIGLFRKPVIDESEWITKWLFKCVKKWQFVCRFVYIVHCRHSFAVLLRFHYCAVPVTKAQGQWFWTRIKQIYILHYCGCLYLHIPDHSDSKREMIL